jgi:hypothetical protein
MVHSPKVEDFFVESVSITGTKDVPFKKYNYSSVYDTDDLGVSPFSFFGSPTDIMDIFDRATNLGYGRIDTEMDAVTPKLESLAPIGQSSTVLALTFVAQAFNDLQYNLMSDVDSQNKLKLKGGPYENFNPARGWQSIDTRHTKVLENTYIGFLIPYLLQNGRQERILNFDDFLKIFLGEFFNSVMLPNAIMLTRSGFALSRKSTPLASGLVIDLARDNYNNDKNKYDKWLNHLSYHVVRDAAANFGFALDKHAPWRFIANLQSPNMLPYIQGKGLLKDKTVATRLINGNPIQAADVYNVFCEKIYKKDIDVLKAIVYNFYNQYAKKRPYVSLAKVSACPTSSSSLSIASPTHSSVTKLKARKVITFEEMEKKYDDYFWLNQYFIIRLAESRISMGTARVKRQLRKISYINKYLGYDKALTYINEYVNILVPPLAGSLFGGASVEKTLQITGQAAAIPATITGPGTVGGSVGY